MSARGDRPAPRGVRVATWNILHGVDLRTGRVDLDMVSAVLAALDADVIAVQEADRRLARSGRGHQIAELADRLGYHGVFAPAVLGGSRRPRRVSRRRGPVLDIDPDGPGYGVGILARIPILEHDIAELPARRDPRIALRVIVPAPWGALSVTTAHLSMWPWRTHSQLVALARFARGDAMRTTGGVLAGDLNAPPRAVRHVLSRRGWRVATTGPTFPAWNPARQLDHVAVRGPVGLRQVTAGPAGPSDHLPVTATVCAPAAQVLFGRPVVVMPDRRSRV